MPGNRVEPTPTATSKYSGLGAFSRGTFHDFGLSPTLVRTLQTNANHSLAANTWASYATAERHLNRAAKATGVPMECPLSLRSTLAYVGYLLSPKSEGGRGLKGVSVEKYLSALRIIHMKKGYFEPWIRPEIISLITRGAKQRDQVIKRLSGKKSKHAMTPQLMWELKKQLNGARLPISRKRIIWATATIAFAGSLRVHELLAREQIKFDPSSVMLSGAIKVKKFKVQGREEDTLSLYIAHPKEDKLAEGVVIDLFQTQDFMCPIKAYRNWQKDKGVKLTPQKPLFRLESGRSYTGKLFNKDIRSLMKRVIDYDSSPITAHSFRRGLATFMAKEGYSDHDIMTIGRWKSQAFKAYIAAPRVIRGKLAAALASKVARSVNWT